MKIYIAGPMRNYERYNFPAFDQAAQRLRFWGHDVYSPAEMDREIGFDETAPLPEGFLAGALQRDIEVIFQVDAIAVLSGWERSRGARHEVELGLLLGKEILFADTLQPIGQGSFAQARRYAGAGDGGYLVPEGALVL